MQHEINRINSIAILVFACFFLGACNIPPSPMPYAINMSMNKPYSDLEKKIVSPPDRIVGNLSQGIAFLEWFNYGNLKAVYKDGKLVEWYGGDAGILKQEWRRDNQDLIELGSLYSDTKNPYKFARLYAKYPWLDTHENHLTAAIQAARAGADDTLKYFVNEKNVSVDEKQYGWLREKEKGSETFTYKLVYKTVRETAKYHRFSYVNYFIEELDKKKNAQ